MTQNNIIKNRGLKKAKWTFKILKYNIENIKQISEISKSISTDYKITFTNDNLEIDITLKNSNYSSFIINSFKEIIPSSDVIIDDAKTKNLDFNIDNIYDIIVNLIIDIESEIKLLNNSKNSYSYFLELYSKDFESQIDKIKIFLNFLNVDSLDFFKITGINDLEILRQYSLLYKVNSFYTSYKKNLLSYNYHNSLLISNNHKLTEITLDENKMINYLNSQCIISNPNLNIEDILYNSAISEIKENRHKLPHARNSYNIPFGGINQYNLNSRVELLSTNTIHSNLTLSAENDMYCDNQSCQELESLQDMLINESVGNFKKDREFMKKYNEEKYKKEEDEYKKNEINKDLELENLQDMLIKGEVEEFEEFEETEEISKKYEGHYA